MPARPFIRWPDPRLSAKAAPIAEITPEILEIWDDMIASMEAMPGQGVGLAAPQIGVGLRLAVVNASDERGRVVRMANPELVDTEGAPQKGQEASPNLPGISGLVARPPVVLVNYMDHHGFMVRDRFEGLWARSLLHQIDHLDGKLYIDRLSRVKRDMLLRKWRKGA